MGVWHVSIRGLRCLEPCLLEVTPIHPSLAFLSGPGRALLPLAAGNHMHIHTKKYAITLLARDRRNWRAHSLGSYLTPGMLERRCREVLYGSRRQECLAHPAVIWDKHPTFASVDLMTRRNRVLPYSKTH